MTTELALCLLEVAPDEDTALILVERAIEQGITRDRIEASWRRGEEFRHYGTWRGEL